MVIHSGEDGRDKGTLEGIGTAFLRRDLVVVLVVVLVDDGAVTTATDMADSSSPLSHCLRATIPVNNKKHPNIIIAVIPVILIQMFLYWRQENRFLLKTTGA